VVVEKVVGWWLEASFNVALEEAHKEAHLWWRRILMMHEYLYIYFKPANKE
jgi:hypothetical protein